MKKILFSFIFTFASLLTCYAEDKFASGEIVVGFKESVSGQQALEILKNYNLPIKDIVFSRYTYFFRMPENNTQNYMRYLLNSKLFDVAETQLDSTDSPFDIVFAYAKLETLPEDVNRFIQGLEALSIQSMETHAISLSVKVNAGQEKSWIATLKKDPAIEYAELNYMAEIAS